MAREELIIKLNMLEQHAEEKKQQIGEIDRQLEDMIQLNMSLGKLENGKGKEILSALGRGVFLNTLVNDEKVFVNVGSKTLVRKSFHEAMEIITGQIAELEEMKAGLLKSIEDINIKLYELLEEAQKIEESEK